MAKVLIGCKLPNGITMELIKPHPQPNSLNPAPRGKFVKLNGSASVTGGRVARINAAPAYGTTLVDAEFAKAWFDANKDSPLIDSGAVFVAENEKEFNATAKDYIDERSGFEPVNPAGDPRTPEGVEADPDQMKRLGVAQTAAALARQ